MATEPEEVPLSCLDRDLPLTEDLTADLTGKFDGAKLAFDLLETLVLTVAKEVFGNKVPGLYNLIPGGFLGSGITPSST